MNAAETKLQPTSDERQKILVIDDDAVIRQFMERIISDAGHEVRTVRDELSALDVLNSYRLSGGPTLKVGEMIRSSTDQSPSKYSAITPSSLIWACSHSNSMLRSPN